MWSTTLYRDGGCFFPYIFSISASMRMSKLRIFYMCFGPPNLSFVLPVLHLIGNLRCQVSIRRTKNDCVHNPRASDSSPHTPSSSRPRDYISISMSVVSFPVSLFPVPSTFWLCACSCSFVFVVCVLHGLCLSVMSFLVLGNSTVTFMQASKLESLLRLN